MSSGADPSTPAPTLDYRHRPRMSIIGRHKKKLIFLALCLAIGVPIYRNWEPLKRRAVWIYWVHQAAAHQMPAQPFERVIIDPDRASAAVAANSEYTMDEDVALYAPLAYRRLVELDPRIPKSWRGTITSHLLFMGTMLQPDGTPRLVIVTEDRYSGSSPYNILVFPIPGWADPLPPATKSKIYSIKDFVVAAVPQITSSPAYTATLDPNDRSHLTFSTERPVHSFQHSETPAPATMPSTRIENIRLSLQNDGRFLERIDGGRTYMIEPIERPPQPTLRGQ